MSLSNVGCLTKPKVEGVGGWFGEFGVWWVRELFGSGLKLG